MNYKDYNDYELIDYVNDNNEEAMEIIYEKYKPLINSYANRMYKTSKQNGIEISDLIQEGMLGLNSAVKTFNEQKNVTFYTYAKSCIENKIISYFIANNRLKHKPLNDSMTIDVDYEQDNLIDFSNLVSDNTFNPEIVILDNEDKKETIQSIKKELTPLETSVFELMIKGFTYIEIAKMLNKDSKSIDNAFQRIKGKIKKMKNEI